jgi:hypothetical protein
MFAVTSIFLLVFSNQVEPPSLKLLTNPNLKGFRGIWLLG